MFYVYLLQLNDQRIYVGHTHDLDTRLNEHRTGKGARTTTTIGFFDVIHVETFPPRREAVARERQLKGWSRAKKLALARQDITALKALSTAHTSIRRRWRFSLMARPGRFEANVLSDRTK